MLDDEVLEAFHDSYARVKDCPEFFDVFYERFISSSNEITTLFEGVDIKRTKKMVKDALVYMLMASDASGFGKKKVKMIAEKHSGFKVKQHHFDLWLDSLMSVVEEMDPKYTQDIDSAWRKVMNIGISIMKSQNMPSKNKT